MKLHAWIRRLAAMAALAAMLPATAYEPRHGTAEPGSEFRFMRLQYTDTSGDRSARGAWLIDYPQAEYHFTQGVKRMTRVDIGEPGMVSLDDPRLFDYPWLYAVEVGHWSLDDSETARLREYLLRGGFLMVDDFHGTYEWSVFVDSMNRVFPHRPIVEIPEDEPLMHVLYDLNKRIQIPGIRALMRGRTYEQDGVKPHWRGIYDDNGRLMVVIDFNMDLGDAWELADDPRYPEPMTALAYRFAVNYVIYSMTH
jgi:hypothetical protein